MRELYRLLADGHFHSGSELGQTLGVSRAAIWKKIKKLQEQGVAIQSVTGKGYQLSEPVTFIDEQRIKLELPAYRNIFVFDQLDSTNLEVRRQLKTGINDVLVIAEEQTEGRGRRGRQWESPYATNIYLSVSWPVTQGMAQLEGLSLSVGLAVYRTLQPYLESNLGLKWPNDVLIGHKKVAGILIELLGDPADSFFAVIGIGININLQANQLKVDSPWTSLALETGKCKDRNELIVSLVSHLREILKQQSAEGFVSMRKEWEQVHLWQNKMVSLSFTEHEVVGKVLGVSPKGELELLVGDEQKNFAGGELTLRLQDDS